MPDPTSLAEIAGSPTVDALLQWETRCGHVEDFVELDHLLGAALTTMWRGDEVVTVHEDPAERRFKDRLEATWLPPAQRELLERQYGLAEQQGRGAWYIPEELSLKPFALVLPARLLAHPQHALVLAHDVAAGSDPSTTSAAAVWVWCSLEPTAALLLRPLTIWAGERSLLRSTDEADKSWAGTQAELRRLAADRCPTQTR